METTEKIVEAYVRHVKGWATISNIRCQGQYEIDLLAIDPKSLARYHIETSVSVSHGFAKLTAAYDPALAKVRVQKPKMRRTLGYFSQHKFETPSVVARLKDYGFEPGAYTKIIVSLGWEAEAKAAAEVEQIQLWDFRDLMREIADSIRGKRSYFTDDTLRTIGLFVLASEGRMTRP